jgi:hypothetical protein
MSLRRFSVAMVAVIMLAALIADSASAAVTTNGSWHVEGRNGGAALKAGEAPAVGCEAVEGLELEGLVGTTKVPITLTAENVECIEASIFNDESGAATDQGKLRFTGVTVDTPAACSVEGGTVTTNNLRTELYMDSSNSSIAFDKFEAASGITNLAIINLIGAECPITGAKGLKGALYGRATRLTEAHAVIQPLKFGKAEEETATGKVNLEFAGNPAELEGTAVNFLTGTDAGKKFWGAATSPPPGVITGGSWYEEGVGKLPANTHTAVACEAEGNLKLVASIGAPKVPITLTATGVECIEASIFNDENGAATDQGKLRFTGVTVDDPAACSVENGTVTTNNLHTELYMDSSKTSIAFDKFEPATGITNLAVVKLIGPECFIAGSRSLKGTFYGQAVNATGIQAVTQPLKFGKAVEETATGKLNLEFAGNPAELEGQTVNFLTGVGLGKKFWAE